MVGSKADFTCTRTIPENMYTLASRIEDADHGADWLDSCVQSYTVRDTNNPKGKPNRVEFEAYERLKGLPKAYISDRDVYLHGRWRRDGAAIVCELRPSTRPVAKPPHGVVRMRDLHGTFRLTPAGAHTTHVNYSLNVDLGGWIPGLVKDEAVKEIPRKSLVNLARQAQKGPGIYAQNGQELAAALKALKGV